MYADGNVYEGEWKDGVQHDQGKIVFASGDVFEGEYKEGKKERHTFSCSCHACGTQLVLVHVHAISVYQFSRLFFRRPLFTKARHYGASARRVLAHNASHRRARLQAPASSSPRLRAKPITAKPSVRSSASVDGGGRCGPRAATNLQEHSQQTAAEEHLDAQATTACMGRCGARAH